VAEVKLGAADGADEQSQEQVQIHFKEKEADLGVEAKSVDQTKLSL
jgi:hypothetical protein